MNHLISALFPTKVSITKRYEKLFNPYQLNLDIILFENSEDPDQLAFKKPADLD